MIHGEVEFLADTLLLEKVAVIQYGLQKTAGFGDTLKDMLGNATSSVSSAVSSELSSMMNTSSPETIIASLGKMILNGGIFMLWRPLGIINLAARAVLGIDAGTIAEKIWRRVSGLLSSKGQVSQQEVSEITRDVTAEFAGSDSGAVRDKRSSYDLLEPLRTAEKNGQLYSFVKNAMSFEEMSNWFSKISPFKARSVVGGMVGWVIKAALIGAGLMAATGSLARLLGIRKEEIPGATAPTTPQQQTETTNAVYEAQPETAPAAPNNKLTPTGRGQDTHLNDHVKTKWIVPMVGGSVQSTLIAWARDVYVELAHVDDSTFRELPSFNKIVGEVSRFLEANSRKITVPPRYKSRRQVVDQFASDAAKHMDGQLA